MVPTARVKSLGGRAALLLGAILMTAGCVTINIYFPAAAAEKAADRIIDGVWQLPNGQGKTAPADGDRQ
ncbi:MAG: hypothetical protein KDH17_08430 [Rhodocyclaceae bacterium]|nr:hypothetical protein [Rhodocyclaceae bacterium]